MRHIPYLALLALLAPAANAVPIRVDFTIGTPAFQGTPPGTGSAFGGGYFVFDDSLLALVAPGGQLGDSSTPLPTIDLEFNWLGQHFDETNGTLGMLGAGPGGVLSSWSIDGLPASGCSFQCVTWGTSDFNVLGANGPLLGNGSALLTQAGVSGVAVGNVTWSIVPVGVPEPGTLALLAVALAGAATARRRAR